MASHVRRVLLLALMVVAASALVACGGTSKADYAKDVRGIVNPLDDKLSSLNQDITSGATPKDKADSIKKAQTQIADAAKKLDDLTPPDDVKKEHDKFVAAVKKFGEDLGPISDAVSTGNAAGAQEAFSKLQSDAQALQSAQDDLEKQLD
jgi:cytochrome c556